MITEELVAKAKCGNDEAFAELYEAINSEMYRLAYYMLANSHDAEDMVAEAVLDMYRDIRKLKNNQAFKVWAMRILWVKCKLKLKEYCRKEEALDTVGEKVSKSDVEGQAVLKEDIEKAMKCLTDDEKLVVMCSAVAGMNSSQISEVTGWAKGTIRSKLSRALKKVRERLEEYA